MDRNLEGILDTGGRQLTTADRQFVNTLFSELEQFQYQAPKDRALMFHPLGGYQRYLIHKVTEIFPKLTSFSIGDDQNRRTVVCFQSKRKEQQLQQMAPNSPSRQMPHGRGNDYGPAPTRSRESLKPRNRPNEAPSDRPGSKKGKHPDQATYLPKPLRSKKAAKQANSLPRSRSLHASPARQPEHEPYYTDDDKHLRKDRGDGTPASRRKERMRSSSVREPRKSRSRPSSPPDTERPRSGMVSRPSENSLKKRGQGLRLEGMNNHPKEKKNSQKEVINGDVEDPYSRDSDYDHARSDAEAIKREKSRKRQDAKKKHKSRRAKSEPESSDQDVSRSRRRHPHHPGSEARHRSESEDSEVNRPRRHSASANSKRKPDKTTDRKQKEARARHDSKKRLNNDSNPSDDDYMSDDRMEERRPSHSRPPEKNGYVDAELDFSSEDVPDSSHAGRELDNDELPPSYDKTSQMGSPASKAKRNLNRIRRADSLRSRSPVNTDRSPSNSSARSETTSRYDEEYEKPKRKSTSTFPRQSKRRNKPEADATETLPMRKSPTKHHKERESASDIPKRRKSVSSGKSSRSSTRKPKKEVLSDSHSRMSPQDEDQPRRSMATRRQERADVHRRPGMPRRSEENLLASDSTLYMPLPDKAGTGNHYVEPAQEYPVEHEYVNRPQNILATRANVSHQAPPSSHSTLSSPATDASQGFAVTKEPAAPKCDGAVQTEVTGTLTRKSGKKASTKVAKSVPAQAAPAATVTPPVVEAPIQESPSYHTPDSSMASNSTTPSVPANEKLMEEFCKVMLNFQKMFIASQTPQTHAEPSGYSSPSHAPKMDPFHPFASYYPARNGQDGQPALPMAPMALYNQFPPHIAQQLYLSWMAAYYAGATGSWPPPPPSVPQMPGAPDQSTHQRYDYPPAMHGAKPANYPLYPAERGNGGEPHSGSFGHPDFFQPPHSMYSQPPNQKETSNYPHDEYQPAAGDFTSGAGSQGDRSNNAEWDRDSQTRGRPSHRWSSKDSKSKSEPSRSASTLLTDGVDTDNSSANSSSTHAEVALKEGRSGVVVYVRSSSHSNSRANSTVSGGEDAVSVHSSSSHGLTLAPPAPTKITSRSRDGDDEDTPDFDSKPLKKKNKPVNGVAPRSNESPNKKHGKRSSRDKRVSAPKGGSVNEGDMTPPVDVKQDPERAPLKMPGEGVDDCSEISAILVSDVKLGKDHAVFRADPTEAANAKSVTPLCQSSQHDLSSVSHSNISSGETSLNRSSSSSSHDTRNPSSSGVYVPPNAHGPLPPFSPNSNLKAAPKEVATSTAELSSSRVRHKLPSDLEPIPQPSNENPDISIANEEVILSLSRAPLATMDEDEEIGVSEDNLSSNRSYHSERSINTDPYSSTGKLETLGNAPDSITESRIDELNDEWHPPGGDDEDILDKVDPKPPHDNPMKTAPKVAPEKIPETELPIVVSEFDLSGESAEESCDEEAPEHNKEKQEPSLEEDDQGRGHPYSSSSDSSDEDATHVYETRSDVVQSDTDDRLTDDVVNNPQYEEELPPPPTSTDLQSILGQVLTNEEVNPRKPSSHLSTEGSGPDSDDDAMDTDEKVLGSNENIKNEEEVRDDTDKFSEDNLGEVEDNFKEFKEMYDKKVLEESEESDDEAEHLIKEDVVLNPESLQKENEDGEASEETDVMKTAASPPSSPQIESKLLAGSPTGFDMGSIPHIDDVSDSQSGEENSDVESSLKNNGYDADRSMNLGSEEDADNSAATPVNGLTNGPNTASHPELQNKTIQQPQFDYYNWKPNEEMFSSAPYDSIVEIHDFPSEFRDGDIIKHFKKYKGFKLVWVDDTHAIGMFATSEEAKSALSLGPHGMRIRPLVHASTQSRQKARIRVEEFGDYSSAPSNPRPETTNVVAKKMVLGALGMKSSQRDKERQAELRNMRMSKKHRPKE